MVTMQHDGLNIEHYTAFIVALALVGLVLIGRGFRGVDVGGVSLKAS